MIALKLSMLGLGNDLFVEKRKSPVSGGWGGSAIAILLLFPK